MIDIKKYEEYRNMYINEMPERFKKKSKGNYDSYGELDKWIGIKEFQNNWDLNSENIFEMFKKCTNYIVGFLDINRVYPIRMLKQIINEEVDCFKDAFSGLFDLNKNLEDRCNSFINVIDDFKKRKHNDLSFFNTLHLATFFEVMMYPENNYIYNYDSNNNSMITLSGSGITAAKPFDRYMQFCTFAEDVRKIIISDDILINEFNKFKNELCYDDDNCFMLTTDFLFFVGRINKTKSNNIDEEFIIPKNFSNGKLNILIDKYRSDFESSSFIKNKIDERDKRREELYGNLSNDKILNASEDEVRYLLNRMWAVGGLSTNNILANNNFEEFKKNISNLLFSDANIRDRYNNCRKNCWGFKSAAITELLTGVYPDKFMLVNSRIIDVFNYLGIVFSDDIDYETFENYLNVGKYIQNMINESLNTNFNLFEIDYFYHYVSTRYKNIIYNDFNDAHDRNADLVIDYSECDDFELEENDIYYGVPGCGKSFEVNKEYAQDNMLFVRTVFHPDYTYTDFVGQVMPSSDNENEIKYKKIAGPLTVAISKALNNPGRRVTLIIEEINRGNAAAIFGDLFQLLDRKSTYCIENEFIKSYCNEHRDENGKPFIGLLPNNLKIVATMNTSDQNVYVLDNAFRRRWNFKRVKNKIADDDTESGLKDAVIAKSNIKWDDFYQVVNDYIISDEETLLNNEDKRLGAYSVTKEQVENAEMFADKVLMYLWDNVARYNPSRWFKNYDSKEIVVYDQLLDFYLDSDNLLDIFVDELKNELLKGARNNE